MNSLSFSAILLAFAAAAIPFFSPATIAAPTQSTPWPTSFEGRPIKRIAPAPADRFLARQFPGQVARFSDGRRQIVLRRVAVATRALHPASDCFRAIGYTIEPVAMRIATDGKPASCFTATRDGRILIACEQVRGANADEAWPDVSSWYWAALLGRSAGPWTASLTVEQAPLTQPTPE
ncbi:hypothetical protein G4G27_14975 [Sphingomonas sp. So64.6b]|uniref:hypothetical protein n=1 Tax=Sphingomonas sp. So64.6b TaxID=2997354 RepID=UPI0016002FB0|nr:hypothetical protein [Sphingomonas sp. So64.6b]QNA85155.1 hypothetical protein G4G27_14975 [Sphingomonas sp. So64.6b]